MVVTVGWEAQEHQWMLLTGYHPQFLHLIKEAFFALLKHKLVCRRNVQILLLWMASDTDKCYN